LKAASLHHSMNFRFPAGGIVNAFPQLFDMRWLSLPVLTD